MEQTTTPNTSHEAVDDAMQATQESLDKVRDILFGSQMRDQDRRFVQIEEKVAAELTAFREETRKGLRSIEEFVTAELSALASRLTSESTQRHDAIRQVSDEAKQSARVLSDECRGAAQAVDKRVAELDQQHAAAEAEIRKQLHEASGALREELKGTHNELHALVEKLVTELRGAKTDRAALAGLFNEMAGKLQG